MMTMLDLDMNTILIPVIVSVLVSTFTCSMFYLIIKKRDNKSNHKKNEIEIPPETHKEPEEVEEGDVVIDKQTCEDPGQITQPEESEVDEESHQYEQEMPNTMDIITDPNEDGKIVRLTISDGLLVVASIEKTAYYFCWRDNGKLFYKINNEEKINKKAIYNHEAVIDPFCDKTDDSVLVDRAKIVETMERGELDSDYKVLKKTLVRFK